MFNGYKQVAIVLHSIHYVNCTCSWVQYYGNLRYNSIALTLMFNILSYGLAQHYDKSSYNSIALSNFSAILL